MAQRNRKITDRDQRVAAEILTAFMFCNNMDDVNRAWKATYEAFALCDDPFTGCPCSSKEAEENSLKYRKQVMMERYGHCDGLE